MRSSLFNTIKKPFSLFLAILLCAGLFSGCGRTEKRTANFYTYFDTVTTVTGYDTAERFSAASALVEEVLSRYHRATDIYHEYSGEVNAMTVNRCAAEAPVAVSDELFDVISYGKEAYSLTNGMCSIAFGAVLSLWHEKREAALNGEEAALPSEDALRSASEHCSMDDLILDEAKKTVYFADSALSLDLGAVAKGYATEMAAQALSDAGYTGYILSVGGNVRTVGAKPDGSDWSIGIQNPDTESSVGYLCAVAVTDCSLVTSGSYQRFFTFQGERYHHIISPETLYPKNDFLSVSVRAKSSAMCDALSTALFNMSLADGLSLVRSLPDTEVCWITADGEMHYSDGFEAFLIG